MSHNFPANKKTKVSSSTKCNKSLGNPAEKIFERQTKATLEVNILSQHWKGKNNDTPGQQDAYAFLPTELFPFAETVCF